MAKLYNFANKLNMSYLSKCVIINTILPGSQNHSIFGKRREHDPDINDRYTVHARITLVIEALGAERACFDRVIAESLLTQYPL